MLASAAHILKIGEGSKWSTQREAVWTGCERWGDGRAVLKVYSSFMVINLKSEWLGGFVLAIRASSKSSESWL